MSTARILALTIDKFVPEQIRNCDPFERYSAKRLHVGKWTLATVNINPLPAKQPSVYRPCAGPKHDETCSERNKQKVHTTSAPMRQPYPNLDHCLQSSRNGCPQSSQ